MFEDDDAPLDISEQDAPETESVASPATDSSPVEDDATPPAAEPATPEAEPISRAELDWYRQRNAELEAHVSQFQASQTRPPNPQAQPQDDENIDPEWRTLEDRLGRLLDKRMAPIQERIRAQEEAERQHRNQLVTEQMVTQAGGFIDHLNKHKPGVNDDPELGARVKAKVEKAIRAARARGADQISVEEVRSFYNETLEDMLWSKSRAHAAKAVSAAQGAPAARIPSLRGGTSPSAAKPKGLDYDNFEDVDAIRKIMRKG